ncbi:MAG: hypothetical protein A3H96_11485 [Acidobacteria bacterium RIFCSPLOWO2_02_FULL_67_36]|nr:MAG: hypothetical protein A3H96_11485 [Acidobacteria bacterium RIFCSPLOWO2_02_FULL_67_36]OGA76285.1 MAG: hypothetical protein A3G27_05730 [Betaproteobacteria bacterium RIFCSPLOWO2_12_FULL_66_14]
MARCPTCFADLDRKLAPFEDLHIRTNSATDERHIRPGAGTVGADVGPARRARMNRIQAASGLSLSDQICRALDVWFASASSQQEVGHARARRAR